MKGKTSTPSEFVLLFGLVSVFAASDGKKDDTLCLFR